MERIMQGLNRILHGNKRQMLTAAAAAFIVYVLLLSGIFSYFHSEDAVTNRLESKNMVVRLLEPDWDSTGQYKAAAMEPGMTIPKNPYALNDGQYNLYIRIKMTVKLGEFDSSNKFPEYEADFHNNARRLNSILNNLKRADDASLFDWDSTTGEIRNWTLSADCLHPDYYMEYAGENSVIGSDGEYVYYFYYVTGTKDGENSTLKVVRPSETTSELFKQMTIPIYKQDYLGVFDQGFDITLEAQAIPVDPDESSAVSAQKPKFH